MSLRLSKRMADLGLCSRREADVLIAKGWVLVNGQVVDVLGSKVEPSDEISLSPAASSYLKKKQSIILYKPVGYVSHASEDHHPHVFDLLKLDACKSPNPMAISTQGLAPVGRLDIDSKGLLILSQDGSLARKIIAADSPVAKAYVVKLNEDLNAQELGLLSSGKAWANGQLKPVKVRRLRKSLYELELKEGKNRQIRKMMEYLNKQVLMLKRIRIGNLDLKGLEEGQWRRIEEKEKQILMSL
tara:strand:+ start:5189 stop:5917 length:729 start_codon:yes stop_codon:yes gene_type:complete